MQRADRTALKYGFTSAKSVQGRAAAVSPEHVGKSAILSVTCHIVARYRKAVCVKP